MKTLLRLSILAVVLSHYFLLGVMIMAVRELIFNTPWYVFIPLIVMIVRIGSSRSACPLSQLEAYLERKLGIPECQKFIKSWCVPWNAQQNWVNLWRN